MTQHRKIRIDTERHRGALLEAASAVFSRQGVHVPLEAVVAESGLGRATLYRHFPDRAALLLALFDRDIRRLDKVADHVPPERVFVAMLTELGLAAREAPVLADAWRLLAADYPEMLERQRRVVERFAKPLSDAVAAGEIRPDLTLADVETLCRMITSANRSDDAAGDGVASGRIMSLVLCGIATGTAASRPAPKT